MLERFPIKEISFFGNGEPLLYFDTIKKIVELAKSKGQYSFTICTNSVFGNRRSEIVRFLVENNFYMQISIDGYKAIQDKQRPMANKRSPSEEVEKTIEEIIDVDLDKFAMARFTLTKEAFDH
ncbi:MAG: hypothetical protein ARM1_0551 [Candidatus Micrarchaeota archaeon]|nr:MAG: hypothetical protein ARM1_0551 [Candidatus Micrarchaeota archaeon]